jgi:hypothetical protein
MIGHYHPRERAMVGSARPELIRLGALAYRPAKSGVALGPTGW